jgi:phenylalanyl-tRNA synthetase beta chain
MKASIKWLEDFVDLSGLSPREIADQLTMAGLEVEELRDRFDFLAQVVSARVASVRPLSAASEHLKICQVEAGSFGRYSVVCGAPNVREGLVAPLALVGAELPGGLVRGADIRGQFSEGLLCSEKELGLGRDQAGLMELGQTPGRTLKEITGLEDWLLEIGITPNRPDALSIMGLARDLSALLNRPWRRTDGEPRESGPDVNTLAKVSIEDPEHCYRFAARVIEDLKIGPSPAWLIERLEAVGLRSINNVVDVTNYVMMEMGQPLHAYDLETLADHHLIARVYPQGVHFTTLDGQDRELTADVNLMICDGEKAVGLAGVMGGLNSEIKDTTKRLMLEGACFNATTIRRTSRSLGLSTDASYRFERGCDPEICLRAVNRAISLMAELAGGRVAAGVIDRYPRPFKAIKVSFSPSRCNAYLGTSHQTSDMRRVLSAIGLIIEGQGDDLTVSLPSWRPDLSREVDVREEVARLLDFDQLPATLPQPPAARQAPPPAWVLREMVREHLCARGLSESITYSFINRNFADKLSLPEDSFWRRRILPIMNPLSEEQGILRPLMIPSLLAALRLNQSHGRAETALFEQGAVFLSNGLEQQPEERLSIAAVWSGQTGGGTWVDPRRPVDFWDLKGLVEGLAEHLNLALSFTWSEELPPWYDLAEAALVSLNDGPPLGHLGRLNRKAAKAFGLKEAEGPVYLFELDGSLILERGFSRRPFEGWSKFPPNERDLAVVLDQTVPSAGVISAIKGDGRLPLTGVTLFDLYQGGQLPAGKKSLAFRLTFQSPERTLTDEEVAGYFETITGRLAERFGAVLRS